MKSFIVLLISASLLVFVGCMPKKPEPIGQGQTAPNQMRENPHAHTPTGPGLDLESMLAKLPEGWTKIEASSSMRLAEIKMAKAKGDAEDAVLAVFHFPGTGGDAAANIIRWQRQMEGPNGEAGTEVAVTDTITLYGITIITTDITGTLLPAGMGMGPDSKTPNSRMIASVIETGVGNWFIKVTGPKNTVAAHLQKYREFLKTAKLQEEAGA
jgi:hypothetical protein